MRSKCRVDGKTTGRTIKDGVTTAGTLGKMLIGPGAGTTGTRTSGVDGTNGNGNQIHGMIGSQMRSHKRYQFHPLPQAAPPPPVPQAAPPTPLPQLAAQVYSADHAAAPNAAPMSPELAAAPEPPKKRPRPSQALTVMPAGKFPCGMIPDPMMMYPFGPFGFMPMPAMVPPSMSSESSGTVHGAVHGWPPPYVQPVNPSSDATPAQPKVSWMES